jgi:hypothetical protein
MNYYTSAIALISRFFRKPRVRTQSPVHDLWSGADLKVQSAGFFLSEMSRSLQPPEQTAINVVLESSGAIVGNLWEQSFYPRLDAFLAMARSVPEVIESCFGADRVLMKTWWWNTLTSDEKKRRRRFSRQFRRKCKAFRRHALSKARNISFHRDGYVSVEVRITGLFGVEYIGNPVRSVPIAERHPNNPGPPFRQIALPIRPMWSDFTIDGKPLFSECQAYLQLAIDLRAKADAICQQVHGNDTLTRPC